MTTTRTGPPGVRTRVWKDGRVTEEDYPLAQVSDHLARGDSIVWVDLASPSHDVLAALADELSLDPNSVEDAVAHDERPKATDYGRYAFVTAYACWTETGDLGVELGSARVSAFVMDHALVTVHDASWTGMSDVVARWDALGPLVEQNGVDALLHGLLDHVVDGQFDTVQALEDAIDDLEDGLFGERPYGRDDEQRAFGLRRCVVSFRRVAAPMSQVVATLHRLRGHQHPGMDSSWVDLDDHVARVVEWTDSARDLLNNVFAATMSLQDARMNQVMKKLTAWAAIIAVPTAITGFYGQNVPYPGFGKEWGFAVSGLVCAGAMLVLYLSFKRRDWL